MKTQLSSRILYLAGRNILAILLSAAIVLACTTQAKDRSDHVASLPANAGIPVDAQVVRPSKISDNLDITGTIMANQRVDVVSELTRRLTQVNVKEGSHVLKGTLLFRLDDADLLAQLDRFHQQEKLAKLNEERLKDLLSHDAIAQQDYDEASTTLNVLHAQIVELEVMIAKTKINAPFNGQVGMINVHPGAIVSVNTHLTTIEDNSIVKVEFSIPEKYTNTIQIGSRQVFTIQSDNQMHSAVVLAKDASLNQNTRTLLVRATTSNKDGNLLPGQSAHLTLSLANSDEGLVVPSQSLIPTSMGYNVLVAHNSKVVPTPIEIGQRAAGTVEVVKGLAKGDTVITSNIMKLMPGATVHFENIQ